MRPVVSLLRRIYDDYSSSVGLDPTACYLFGTPIKPVVPLDSAIGGIFILGAYPSARFARVRGIDDVPVADNLGPFEEERWFDGRRVRRQPSAEELERLFLQPLGIKREKCWITDLVKVFLFKQGHVRRYVQLGAHPPQGYKRERFVELAARSLPWIERELIVARPRLLITLGSEVAGTVRAPGPRSRWSDLLKPEVSDLTIGRVTLPAIHCAHPGILMRGDATRWSRRHRAEFLPEIRRHLRSRGTKHASDA